MCNNIVVYAGPTICQYNLIVLFHFRELKEMSLSLKDPYHRQITCVYTPARIENYYWKSIGLSQKADLLVLNTTNNGIFFKRFPLLLERRGKVLVETDDMQSLRQQVGKKFNVLYTSDRLLLFSD